MADHYDVVPESIPTFGPNDPLAGAQWPRIWMDMVKRKLQQKMQDPKANQFMGVLIDLFNQAEQVQLFSGHGKVTSALILF